MAIALALADQGCTTVLSDSRQAVRNYAKGEISPKAARILERADLHNRKHITWFPAHEGKVSETNENRNESAHVAARALSLRAGNEQATQLWFSTKDRLVNYQEITKAYRLARRTLPPPSDKLDRAQAVIFRQLQTGTLLTPLLLHRQYPDAYPDSKCRVCRRETATLTHMLWNCNEHPEEAKSGTLPPRLAAALTSYDQGEQLWAVQQAQEATTRQASDTPHVGRRNLAKTSPRR